MPKKAVIWAFLRHLNSFNLIFVSSNASRISRPDFLRNRPNLLAGGPNYYLHRPDYHLVDQINCV